MPRGGTSPAATVTLEVRYSAPKQRAEPDQAGTGTGTMTDQTTSGGFNQIRPAQAPVAPIRATDRDRDAAIGMLQASYTEGRLTKASTTPELARPCTPRPTPISTC
jgi:hypothetical protein